MTARDAEVLREQLNYLIAWHLSIHPDCAECERLRKVTELLLQPFG